MPAMNINMKGEGCWPDLAEKDVIHIGEHSPPMQIAVLADGTEDGKPSVSFRIDLPDGRVVIAETTARLFCSLARMILAQHPDLFDGD